MSSSDLKFGIYFSQIGAPQRRRLERMKTLSCDSVWVPHSAFDKEYPDAQIHSTDGMENLPSTEDISSQQLALQLDGLTDNPTVLDIALIGQVSPSAARFAGMHGMRLVSLNATTPGGFNALLPNWEIYCRKADEHNKIANRSNWLLGGLIHIAPTRKQARVQVQHGLEDWLKNQAQITGYALVPPSSTDPIGELCQSGTAIIGTAKDAIEQIKRLKTRTDGFGTFLTLDHGWADEQETSESDDLFSRKVIPAFQ